MSSSTSPPPKKRPANGEDGSASRPIAVDLFSGAGGLSLGFEQAGFDVMASVEYDPIHAAVHAFNFPSTEVVCADVSVLSGDDLRAAIHRGWSRHGRAGTWDGTIDAVIGGPPCQGFSLIGKRAFDDTRNQLVFNFARLVGELRPRYFVMENVPGMTSLAASPVDGAERLLTLLVAEFKQHGYSVMEPQVLNACNWGVPQDRRRLILIGTRQGDAAPEYPAPTTSGLPKRPGSPRREDPCPQLASCPTVWDAIGDLPDLDSFPGLIYSDETPLTKKQVAAIAKVATAYVHGLRDTDTPDDLARPRSWDPEVMTSSCKTTHTPAVVTRFASTPQGYPEPVSRLFRLHPAGIACTLRAGTHYERGSFNAPRPIHPHLPRVISVREAARLHAFPDWFRLHWTKWHGFRQVGNSLPPPVGRAVGTELVKAMELSLEKPSAKIALGDPELLVLENLQAADRFGADRERMPRNALRIRLPRSEESAEAA